MRKVLIEQATEDQLRAFSRDVLGIEIHVNAKLATVIAKVKEAWDKPEIVVADDAAQAPPVAVSGAQAPRPANVAQLGPPAGKVRIFISLEDAPGGDEPVPIGVNGKIMLVPRNADVDIPLSYWLVLQNAVRNVYDPLPDGKGINPVARKVPAFPARLVAMGPETTAQAA